VWSIGGGVQLIATARGGANKYFTKLMI